MQVTHPHSQALSACGICYCVACQLLSYDRVHDLSGSSVLGAAPLVLLAVPLDGRAPQTAVQCFADIQSAASHMGGMRGGVQAIDPLSDCTGLACLKRSVLCCAFASMPGCNNSKHLRCSLTPLHAIMTTATTTRARSTTCVCVCVRALPTDRPTYPARAYMAACVLAAWMDG